jgi:two-component system KDP operon response regulator KdpE
MRDVTSIPIFVATSSYTTAKKTKAINAGADVYDPFAEPVIENVRSALELLKLKNRWASRPRKPPPLLTCGDILLSPPRRMVFVKDTEISLTKKEFDALRYLMANDGRFVSHKQILRKVWGAGYSENDHTILWQTIKRLRQKLSDVSPGKAYIKAERGIGYKLLI